MVHVLLNLAIGAGDNHYSCDTLLVIQLDLAESASVTVLSATSKTSSSSSKTPSILRIKKVN